MQNTDTFSLVIAAALGWLCIQFPWIPDYGIEQIRQLSQWLDPESNIFLLLTSRALLVIAFTSLVDHIVLNRSVWMERLLSTIKSVALMIGVWSAGPATMILMALWLLDAEGIRMVEDLAIYCGAYMLLYMACISCIVPIQHYFRRPEEITENSGGELSRWLLNTVNDLSREAGIRNPRVFLVPGAPNAFAANYFPLRPEVGMSISLLKLCEPREIRALLAHEVAHIRNGDTLMGTILQYWMALYFMFSNLLLAAGAGCIAFGEGAARSRQDRDTRQGIGLLGCFLVVCALGVRSTAILADIMRCAWSRSREYLADHTGARICRDPEGLALALEKIEGSRSSWAGAGSFSSAHLQTVNLGELAFSSHPATPNRTKRLRRYGSKTQHWKVVWGNIFILMLMASGTTIGYAYAYDIDLSSKIPSIHFDVHEEPAPFLCGSEAIELPETLHSGSWTSYRCMTKSEAGEEEWGNCLSRSQYTFMKGRGCPGTGDDEARCCPPAPPSDPPEQETLTNILPSSFCGHPMAEIPDSLQVDDWLSHRCLTRQEAGEGNWDSCLRRGEYTSYPGHGCPGIDLDEQLCCPPGVPSRQNYTQL